MSTDTLPQDFDGGASDLRGHDAGTGKFVENYLLPSYALPLRVLAFQSQAGAFYGRGRLSQQKPKMDIGASVMRLHG